jgi:hypothetical protein
LSIHMLSENNVLAGDYDFTSLLQDDNLWSEEGMITLPESSMTF